MAFTKNSRGKQMKKEEFIRRYGEAAYNKMLKRHREWAKSNPAIVERNNNELSRKGGKYYEKGYKYHHTGFSGERARIRIRHANRWRAYKRIVAPGSHIHHEWLPGTSEYRGMALVEADQHMHGYINVIEILDGEITLKNEGI